MDFPIFHVDFTGNRLLVALSAVTHVLINHPMAVGLYPLVVLMEWIGFKNNDERWIVFARKVTFVAFIVTTSLGAMTGVGIWLTTSLVAPYAIGSLLRVFFWAWFTEWTVFITEVVLIIIYYLTWKKEMTPDQRIRHIRFGVLLAIFSWITMAIIVSILGFMMSSGSWSPGAPLLKAIFNPLYLPQLTFRTGFAMVTAGIFVWFLSSFLEKSGEFREKIVRRVSIWSLLWLPLLILGGIWYWHSVPEAMVDNLNMAALSTRFLRWQTEYLKWMAASGIVVVLMTVVGMLKPRFLPRWSLLLPFFICLILLGHFERIREFMRKPWVISQRLYANGIRPEELPLYHDKGMLPYATYVRVREVVPGNEIAAGREIFALSCTRCHTVSGVNALTPRVKRLFGDKPNPEEIKQFIMGIDGYSYMPPFPGSEKEAGALAQYLASLPEKPVPYEGAQSVGIKPAPLEGEFAEVSKKMPVPRDLPWSLPAPEWFLKIALVVLFIAHIMFVDLMVGGTLLAVWMQWRGRRDPRWDLLAAHVAKTVTVNKSIAVVLGIGPLLCINLVYTTSFYAANILTGHAWLMLIPLATLAFLLTYAHSYTWETWTGPKKKWHRLLGILSAALFLMIPFIFLSNINLMLFPDKWSAVAGFLSTLKIGNVLPRYFHFLCASIAFTGLFLAWWWDREKISDSARPKGFTRVDLKRTFLEIMFYATMAQFIFGPLVLLTLPFASLKFNTVVVILAGVAVAVLGLWLISRETNRPDAGVGRSLWPIAVVFGIVVLMMGTGRHLYREASLATYTKAMKDRTHAMETLIESYKNIKP